MSIAPDDVLEVSARMEFDSVEDIVNVYQLRYEGVVAMTDQAGIDDMLEVMEGLYTLIVALQNVLTIYRDIRIRNVTQDVVYGTFAWPTMTVGGNAVDPVAPGVAALVSFSTGVPRVSPRKYLGVLAQSYSDANGLWDSTSRVALALFAASLVLGFSPTNGDWVYGYLSPKTLGFEPVVSGVVPDVPAYQRRRKQGRGS